MDKVEIITGTGSPPVVSPEAVGGEPAHSVGIYSTGSVQQESSICTAASAARVWDSVSSTSAVDAGFSDLKRRLCAFGDFCAVGSLSSHSDSRYDIREEFRGLFSSSAVDFSDETAKEFQPARRAAFMDGGSEVWGVAGDHDMMALMRGLCVLERHPRRRLAPRSGSTEMLFILRIDASRNAWHTRGGRIPNVR